MEEKRMDANFRKRLRRRLYYGNMSGVDTPSIPLTDMAVGYFRDSVPQKLGHVDLSTASNIIRRNRVSPCSVVLSMLYAKRLRQQSQRSKEFLQTMSSSDVFFISMMMASKYLYDEGVEEEVFNDEWADNTDQDVDDVNQMEIDFLQALDWKLFVRPHEFEETLYAIEKRLALQEGLKRGWFTYSELDVLMDKDLVWAVWTQVGSECSKLVTVLSAAYMTSLVSMLGSAALALHISGPLSSATVALLSLQSSPLLTSSSGLSSLDLLALSTSWSSSGLPPGVNLKRDMENHSQPEDMAVQQVNWMDWRSSTELERMSMSRQVTAEEENSTSSRKTGSYYSNENVNEDNTRRETNESHCSRSVKSSIWSLWFLDSFLAQLWAVSNVRSKISHLVGWPTSKSSPGSSLDGCTDENSPCSLKQQQSQNPNYTHRRKMKSSALENKPTNGAQSGESRSAIQDMNGEATPEDHVCSCNAVGSPEAYPWQVWLGNLILRGRCSHCPRETPLMLWSKHPCNYRTGCPCTSHSSSLVPEYLKKHVSCHCCHGVGAASVLHDPSYPSFNHDPPQYSPVKNSPQSVVLLPSLYSTPDMLKVPIGFVTSLFQAAQIT